MQVSSPSNNLYIQYGGSEYLHRAVSFSDADTLVEFEDKESGKLIQFYADRDITRVLNTKFRIDNLDSSVIKATGSLEEYLQKTWSSYTNEFNNKDTNNDGYLDVKEIVNSQKESLI